MKHLSTINSKTFCSLLIFFLLLLVVSFLNFEQACAGNNLTQISVVNNLETLQSSLVLDSNNKDGVNSNLVDNKFFMVRSQNLEWQKLADGFEVVELNLNRVNEKHFTIEQVDDKEASLIILKINPQNYEFTLHMASEDGIQKSLSQHASEHGLWAAINAGMYLPDRLTSTGYMRNGEHINNGHVGKNYGAFFMANPLNKNLTSAVLIEKSSLVANPNLKTDDYILVVQNLRLISASGKILWAKSQSLHSITALATDKHGNIMFIMCRLPVTATDFAKIIQSLFLDIGLTMYLEGGAEAGLLLKQINDINKYNLWRGQSKAIITISGTPDSALPNVLGVRPRRK